MVSGVVFMSEFVIEDIVHIDIYENFGTGYPLDKLSREFFGIIYHVGNRERMLIDGKTIDIAGGEIIFYRQNEKYRIELPDNYLKCYVIDFFGHTDENWMVIRNCEDLFPLFSEAAKLWNRHREDEYYRADCMSITYRIFAEICRRRDRGSVPYRRRDRLARVISEIHENYHSPDLRVRDLASSAGISERYLCRDFTAAYGKSPRQYISDLRLTCARELLRAEYGVGEAARLTGFRDVCQFSAFFRRECGMSPSDFILKKRRLDSIPDRILH